MRTTIKAVTTIVLVMMTVPAGILAQQPAAVPAKLTLEDALAIARERNPDAAEARNSVHAQGAQVRAGWGAFLPTISGSLSFSGSDSRVVTGQDFYGKPVRLDSAVSYQGSQSSQSLQTSLTVFDGFRSLNALRSARASAAAANEALASTETRIEADTKRLFYDAVRARQLIALEDRLLASAREQRDNMDRRFRTANATQEDVLGAEADVASQELQLARAQGDADKAVLTLRQYLGITEPIAFEVDGELPVAWDPSGLDPDGLVAEALDNHPDIARLESQADAAELRVAATRSGYWPTLRVNAGLGRSMSLQSYSALFNLNPQNRALNFGVTLTIPVFTGFQTQAQVAGAVADARNAEEALRAGRLARERDVRSAAIDLLNAYRGAALAQRSTDLSNERLRLSRERYAIGAISFPELQILIDRAAQEERQLINARYSYAAAVAALELQVGHPLRP
jgi:outer membrane protein